MRLFTPKAAAAVLLTLGLLGCAREGDIYQTGILTSYTACPAVAIPAPAGDVTLFNPPASRARGFAFQNAPHLTDFPDIVRTDPANQCAAIGQ